MKVKFLIILLSGLFVYTSSDAQIKDRTSSYSYVGGGYTLVFFTDSEVNNTYPVFDLSNSSFLSEVNLFYGIKASPSIAVEFSPSFIFTNTQSNNGFYYTDNGVQNYYLPNSAKLFALPLNINFKYFPFTDDLINPVSNLYFGVGGGLMYINEEFQNYIYPSETSISPIGIQTTTNSLWTPDFQIMVGFGSTAKFGYGFELGYRIVPLDGDGSKPQTTSLANNFNSVNLSAKVIFSF